ncbi:hypothetical protein [Psychromarinibacter halotolerans]|uniref:Uncharacterized protein n=1 Tax=Psychromarinibacter halotolerans TaxID=1775175 RepID=A0ABV7GTP8_9RHOB|nr:hypothetical protein [Psychromarinibacter halotolerans]MDF0598017.1 hypothetical protein [Psychromarinibacter halotolerans]
MKLLNLFSGIPNKVRATASLALLIIACLIISKTFVVERVFLPDQLRSYTPGLVAGLVAILLTIPIARADLLAVHQDSIFEMFMTLGICVAIVYLTAALATIGLGGNGGWLGRPVSFFVIFIIIISNLNPSRYGELAVLSIGALSAWNISEADNIMGIYGFLIWVFAVPGFVLALDLEKAIEQMRSNPANDDRHSR